MTKDSDLQVSQSRRPIPECVGLIVNGADAAAAIKTIAAAETVGVQQIWMAQTPCSPDVLTILAAAAIKTSIVRLGTSIVPTYPRHPVVLAQQVLALHDIAPGRLIPDNTLGSFTRICKSAAFHPQGWEGRS